MVLSLSERFSQFVQGWAARNITTYELPVAAGSNPFVRPIPSPSAGSAPGPQGYGIPGAGYSALAPEPTDFSVNLVGDKQLISNFADTVRANFNNPVLGGPNIREVGDSTFVDFHLPHHPADIQEVLNRFAQEAGVQVLSIIREAL